MKMRGKGVRKKGASALERWTVQAFKLICRGVVGLKAETEGEMGGNALAEHSSLDEDRRSRDRFVTDSGTD